jgi:hypothetical protein
MNTKLEKSNWKHNIIFKYLKIYLGNLSYMGKRGYILVIIFSKSLLPGLNYLKTVSNNLNQYLKKFILFLVLVLLDFDNKM